MKFKIHRRCPRLVCVALSGLWGVAPEMAILMGATPQKP